MYLVCLWGMWLAIVRYKKLVQIVQTGPTLCTYRSNDRLYLHILNLNSVQKDLFILSNNLLSVLFPNCRVYLVLLHLSSSCLQPVIWNCLESDGLIWITFSQAWSLPLVCLWWLSALLWLSCTPRNVAMEKKCHIASLETLPCTIIHFCLLSHLNSPK